MRVLLVVFIVISAVMALVQYNSSITFIAQLMSISVGRAGRFVPRARSSGGCTRKRIVAPGRVGQLHRGRGPDHGQHGRRVRGHGVHRQSPINCGAIAMVLSLIIVPLVSLFTKRVEFEVDPPHVEGAIDREYEQELEGEGE